MKIGIIAEDDSDVAVISAITLKLLAPRLFSFKKFVGGGCGKLRRKTRVWAENLVQQGCLWIIVVHDLDENQEVELRRQLSAAVAPAGARSSAILLPKKEIESWLLYDPRAIAKAFRETSFVKLPGNPENLPDPKRYLGDAVWKKYRKRYLHTLHNAGIAQQLDVNTLNRSNSFAPQLVFRAEVAADIR
jgi:hypothetical protein